jgi:hypothetical protein
VRVSASFLNPQTPVSTGCASVNQGVSTSLGASGPSSALLFGPVPRRCAPMRAERGTDGPY